MRKPRILCVDDYVPGLELRKASLELGGYAVDAVSSGAAAQALVREPYDLLILDYHLLDMTGADVARYWRRARRKVRIMLLSGSDIPSSALHLVDRFVAKSEPVSELMEAVAELMNRRKKRSESRH